VKELIYGNNNKKRSLFVLNELFYHEFALPSITSLMDCNSYIQVNYNYQNYVRLYVLYG